MSRRSLGQAKRRTYEEAGQSNGETEIGPAQNVVLESHELAVAQVASVQRRKQVEQDAQRNDDSICREGMSGSAPARRAQSQVQGTYPA